jgi:hypothetical protein
MTPTDWVAWFEEAAARQGVTTRRLNIAGRSLRIDVAGDSIESSLCPAFVPLTEQAAAGRESGQMLIWADEHCRHLDFGEATGQTIRLANGGLVVSHALSSAAEAFVPRHTMMLWGIRDAFACGDVRAHPASTAITAWLAQSGAIGLHAGAVGDANGAALLLGRSGAGKSTTVLACAARGMRVLGDDLCVTTTDRLPMVHGLYATAKIARDSEQHLGLTACPALGYTSNDKKVLALSDGAFLPAAPIAALIVLAKCGNQSAPVPLSRNDVIRALVPTAPQAALGAYPLDRWLRTAAYLARRIPGFRVNVDWDLEVVVRSVADALAMGKAILAR